MDLKEVVFKARQQALDNESIKKEILTYFDNPYLFEAMDELCRRNINSVEHKIGDTKITFSMYPRNKGEYKISINQNKCHLGKIKINKSTLEIIPNDADIFGEYEEGNDRENLFLILRNLKLLPNKNALEDLIAEKLNNAL